MRVDKADRNLSAAVQRLADLSAGAPVRFRVVSTERGPNAVEIHLRDDVSAPPPGDNPAL